MGVYILQGMKCGGKQAKTQNLDLGGCCGEEEKKMKREEDIGEGGSWDERERLRKKREISGECMRTSLVVQWLRLHFQCREYGINLWLGNRSHMLLGQKKERERE